MEKKFFQRDDLTRSLALIVGTRPGIIMFSPIIKACLRHALDFFIIHTGQHYSPNMDRMIFEDLELIQPKHLISGVSDKRYHGAQTAKMLEGIEEVLLNERPSIVLVGGDANTNLAGALAARKLHIPLGHVEAGERSFDWRMPEEHNRRIIDHISDYLFTTNEKGKHNLQREQIMGEIYVIGNTIVDAVYQNYKIAKKKSSILTSNQLKPNEYAVLTTHREETVDDPEKLLGIIEGVKRVIEKKSIPVYFSMHPRTLKRLQEFTLMEKAKSIKGLLLRNAPSYLDFLSLLGSARMVLTDSGGVQQEACILHVPCVTLRDNTEWTETIEIGANYLVGTVPEDIMEATEMMFTTKINWENPFGNGNAAEKIIEIIKKQCLNS